MNALMAPRTEYLIDEQVMHALCLAHFQRFHTRRDRTSLRWASNTTRNIMQRTTGIFSAPLEVELTLNILDTRITRAREEIDYLLDDLRDQGYSEDVLVEVLADAKKVTTSLDHRFPYKAEFTPDQLRKAVSEDVRNLITPKN